jgi:hypothetical protein
MEPVKSYRKVRCVSIKGDQVRFVPEHLVEEICKTYKMVKQDSGPKVDWVETEQKTEFKDIIIEHPIENKVWTLEEAKAEYEKLIGKKAGNKKLENILKEIEEVKNKQ